MIICRGKLKHTPPPIRVRALESQRDLPRLKNEPNIDSTFMEIFLFLSCYLIILMVISAWSA